VIVMSFDVELAIPTTYVITAQKALNLFGYQNVRKVKVVRL
jgi:hypothetical protein